MFCLKGQPLTTTYWTGAALMAGPHRPPCRMLAGIPQVLLDFAKEINAKLGPMEEQRIKYGPDLYGIVGEDPNRRLGR